MNDLLESEWTCFQVFCTVHNNFIDFPFFVFLLVEMREKKMRGKIGKKNTCTGSLNFRWRERKEI